MAAPHYFDSATRRAVLGGIGALGAGSIGLTASRAGSSNIDVVIVGAGAAGIGAAIRLQKAGFRCRIVEAASRVGGRALTDTTTFRRADGSPIAFDIGCAWIHRYGDSDPFTQWSRKYRFETQVHDLEVTRLAYGPTRYSESMVKLLGRYETDLKKIMEKSRDVAANRIVPSWQRPMDAAATYMGPMDMTVDFDELSTADFVAMADYDPNYLVREGYGTLVKYVALQNSLDIALRTSVTQIDTRGAGVQVSTDNAGTIDAKAAIVTVSTGVLAKNNIRFLPDLPAATQNAIADLPMGLMAKIPLQLPGVNHYIDGIQPYDNVVDEGDALNDIYFLAWPWDSDLMVGFVGGKFAWELSRLGQAAAIDFAKQKLVDLFGSDIAPRVTAGLMTPWATDPLVLGAYSAAKPGKHASRAVLARPIQKKLYFAGEATGPKGMFATCSGAYMAGWDAAEKIARKFRPG